MHIDGGRGAGAVPRRAGYLKAMRKIRLGAQAKVLPGDFTEEAASRAAERLLGSSDLRAP